MALALSVPSTAAPITQPFGSVASVCGAQWFTDLCESPQAVFGANNRLAVSYDINEPSNKGVLIRGSSSLSPNGISFTTSEDTSIADYGLWEVDITQVAGAGAVVGRIQFFDSASVLLDTIMVSATVAAGDDATLTWEGPLHWDTTSVQLDLGVVGTNTYVYVDEFRWNPFPKRDPTCGFKESSAAFCASYAAGKTASEASKCQSDGGTMMTGLCVSAPSCHHPVGCDLRCETFCTYPLGRVPSIPSGF